MTTKLNIYSYVGFLIIVSIAMMFLLKPFAMSIFIAAMFAVLFYGLYKKLTIFLRGKKYLSSLIMCVFVFLIIILPIIIIVSIALGEAQNLFLYIEKSGGFYAILEKILVYIANLPYMDRMIPILEKPETLNKVFGGVGTLSKSTIGYLQNIYSGVFNFIIGLAVMFFSLFYFFIDGDRFVRALMYYIPLKDSDERLLMQKSSSMLKATLKGTLVIGGVQGIIGGIFLAIAGSSYTLVFTVLMIILSIIPALGPVMILVPYGIFLLATGSIGMGIFILIGAFGISFIDNFLRPKLVGNDTKIHTLWLFFATLGGLSIFGPLGFIIGPIIVTLFITLWELGGDTFHSEFSKSNQGFKSIFDIFHPSSK